MDDTAWVIFMPEIIRQFGCYWADDGRLVGALIDGVTYGSLFPLPVELISFYAAVSGDKVDLFWETSTEVNNFGFEIMRMKLTKNNSGWQKIGFIKGAGTTSEKRFYQYTDTPESSGYFIYKLIQFDFGGRSEDISFTRISFAYNPPEYSLAQNYPNPFNPVTIIIWQSASASRQTVKIFDILGREVATLVDEFRPAERYEIEFEAKGLPAGLYLY
ncbi:MAG: hypothetical protein Kow0098_25050 [Ignavibacteriaceae bacterium]